MNDNFYFEKVTILIVMYKENLDTILKTLEDLEPFKKIIIDNGGDFKIKKEIEKNFFIEKYIVNKKNTGYTVGSNQAISLSTTEYSLLLNPDCFIKRKDIFKLVDAHIKYKNCFIAQATSYDYDKNLSYSGGLLPENGNKDEVLKLYGDTCVQSALLFCSMIKTVEASNLGPFDENFFLYFSDHDLCRRLKKSNKSIIQIHSAKCFHIHGNIKINNKYLKLMVREYNYTYDQLYYFFKDNKEHAIFNTYKKKVLSYFFKFFLKIISFKFEEAIRMCSIICGYCHFYFKFSLFNKNNLVNK